MTINRKDNTMNTLTKFAAAAAFALSAIGASYAAEAPAAMSEGEITKVDKDAGKLTIRHGELKNLGMMPMTMVFRTRDAAMVEQATVGAKIRFVAERVGGALTVTQLETVK
jgi:Cu/Ag efflux protein CusF